MNHVTSYSTSVVDVTWVGFKSMFIYDSYDQARYSFDVVPDGVALKLVYFSDVLEQAVLGIMTLTITSALTHVDAFEAPALTQVDAFETPKSKRKNINKTCSVKHHRVI